MPAFAPAFVDRLPSLRGGFEAHLTVETDRPSEFAALCGELGVDHVAIELPEGAHRGQPMTASHHRGELAVVIAEIEALHARISAAGFTIVRTKLEAAANNEGVPLAEGYFEFHVKVRDERTEELDELARVNGGRLSRNGRSGSRFITQRVYRADLATAETQLDRLVAALDTAAIERGTIAREYTIYDSRIELDAGWLGAAAMNELFAQIRAGDEHAAMVYADLVEQRGDVPRALLIRRQCQLAKLPAWSRAATEARWEVEYLITHFGATWRAELPSLPGVTWLEFDRGFVGSVRVAGASVLHEHAVELGAASPTLSRVVIRDLDEREAPLVHAIPWLRTLCLEAHDEIHLHATRSLIGVCAELEIERGTENTTRFIGTARFGRLERLAVRGEHTAGIPLARDIAANTALHELSVLELGTRFVDFNYGYYGRPTLREAGADVLAATALEYVEVLDVTRQYIGPAGLNSVMRAAPALRELAAGLCDLTNLDALHHDGAPIDRLELRANAIGIAGATAIATAARLRECKHLVLDTCELDGGSIDLLTTAPCWSSLRVLDLSRNALGNEATLALATAPPPKELHTLKLADIEVDREAMIAFATAPWLGQLLEVDLAKLPVPAALLEKLSGVKSLRLAGATFDMAFGMVEGLAAVCERAVVLDLDDTPAMPSFAPELQVLRLARGGFDVRLLSRLLGGGYPRLLELDLSGNAFDEEMVAVLVRNGLIRGLSRLVLKGVVLDGPSIELVAAQGLGPLDLLDLRDVHGYTAEHMLLFARSTALREIKRIAFHGSPWRFPRAAQDELVERFGVRWYDHDDEPDEFNDEDE